jgi:hypothetical protein
MLGTMLFLLFLNAALSIPKRKKKSKTPNLKEMLGFTVTSIYVLVSQALITIFKRPVRFILEISIYIIPLIFGFQAYSLVNEIFIRHQSLNIIFDVDHLINNLPTLVLLLLFVVVLFWKRYKQFLSITTLMLQRDVQWLLNDVVNVSRGKHHDVRCTLWMPIRDYSPSEPIRLKQIIDMLPLKKDYRDNFKDSTQVFTKIIDGTFQPVGLLGRCALDAYTKLTPLTMKDTVANEADLINHLISFFYLTKEQAEKLPKDRRSFLCVTIATQSGEPLGFLYFDSSKSSTFSNKVIEKVIYNHLPRIAFLLTGQFTN